MSRPIIITPEVRARIAQVKAHAESHRLDIKEMMERAEAQREFEDMDQREVNIPIGFRAVYSIEQQPPPLDWCHHFSFSVAAVGRAISPDGVVLLLEEFGVPFPGWNHCISYNEPGENHPLNIIIPFAKT